MVFAFFIGIEVMADQLSLFPVPLALYAMTAVFGVITLLMYRYLSISNAKNPKRFISKFMGALGIKLFASIIFLTVYLFLSEKEYKVSMAIALFVIYMTSNIMILSQITKEIRQAQSTAVHPNQ